MKFTMNVECSPEEARSFFGLPDVQPMQDAVMKELESRMMSNIKAMDPQAMMQQWFPVGMQNFEQFQKLFWGQANLAASAPDAARKK